MRFKGQYGSIAPEVFKRREILKGNELVFEVNGDLELCEVPLGLAGEMLDWGKKKRVAYMNHLDEGMTPLEAYRAVMGYKK